MELTKPDLQQETDCNEAANFYHRYPYLQYRVFEEQSSKGSQTVQMGESNAIELAFTISGTATGTTVNLNFNAVNDYANGVVSANQELSVTSNRSYTVAIKYEATPCFTYLAGTYKVDVLFTAKQM